jgi:hypothetical protein
MSLRTLAIAIALALPGSALSAQATMRVAATILPAARLGAGPSMSVQGLGGQRSLRVGARPASGAANLLYAVQVLAGSGELEAGAAAPAGVALGEAASPAVSAVMFGWSQEEGGSGSRGTAGRPRLQPATASAGGPVVTCRAATCTVRPDQDAPGGGYVVRWLVVPNV